MVMALSELGNKVKMNMEMNNNLIIENGFDVEDDDAEYQSLCQESLIDTMSEHEEEHEQESMLRIDVAQSTSTIDSTDILNLQMITPIHLTQEEQMLLMNCMGNANMKVNGRINWTMIENEFKIKTNNKSIFERVRSRLESSAKWSKKRRRLSEATVQQPIIEEVEIDANLEDTDSLEINMPQVVDVPRIPLNCPISLDAGTSVRKNRTGCDLTMLEREFVKCFGLEMRKAGRVVNMNDLFTAYELKFKEYTRDKESLKKCWDNYKATKGYKDITKNLAGR